MFDAMRNHGVTHYCGAPIVHGLLVNAPAAMKAGVPAGIKAMVAGAAPPASMIEGMEQMGFDLTHVYGLTEVYGPATVCPKHPEWDALDIGDRARLNARQGVRYHLQRDVRVLNPETLQPVPQDGETMGEIMFKGNITMKGYLKNPKATQEAFAGGWFHSGDLAVQYPDGYFKIKDRSKDIIISGGENISSIEVEDVLYRHPAVLAAAVVAKPDARWGGRLAPLWSSKPMRRSLPSRSWRIASNTWQASRCRVRWCLASCPKPARARFRSLSCASRRGRQLQSTFDAPKGQGSQRCSFFELPK
jgi:fatty-acyl-CoA synthase